MNERIEQRSEKKSEKRSEKKVRKKGKENNGRVHKEKWDILTEKLKGMTKDKKKI